MFHDGIPQITVEGLKGKFDRKEKFTLLDVRELEEYEVANLGGLHIPLGELPARFEEVSKDAEIVVHCHHGGRSQRAAVFLRSKGFKNVKNLSGGIEAWSVAIDSQVARY